MNDADELLWDKSKRKRDFYETGSTDEENAHKKVANETIDTKDLSGETPNAKVSTSAINPSVVDIEIKDISKEQLKEDVDNENKFTNEEIHARLKAIDPVMASRLHPNNRRKVLRLVHIFFYFKLIRLNNISKISIKT